MKIRPVVFGGGQERGLRSGTENVPAIAGMARAVEECYRNLEADNERLYGLRQRFVEGVSQMEGVRVNGLQGRESAPHVVSVSFEGVRSEVLLHALEEREIYVSAGSACASNHPDTRDPPPCGPSACRPTCCPLRSGSVFRLLRRRRKFVLPFSRCRNWFPC